MDVNMPSGGVTSASNLRDFDSESTLSDGEDLADDLYDVLSEGFDFEGNFYYQSTDPAAPNPSLSVDGTGPIGLPLSEDDAKLLISKASRAPFGKKEETVIDPAVRDTWEIDPAKVVFRNAKWAKYVDQVASDTVWNALGVAKWASKPRCELHKLLIYETGSHFLAHRDTSKADGMFATIIFVLPSAFQGGEVHVSHSGTSAVIDVSKDSEFNTSIFAWYTDVVHEVKPVTSGYRLALSYNLIHTSRNIPEPTLPDMHESIGALRRVLRKWKEDKYKEAPSSPPLIAYILSHEYSQSDLKCGVQCLKGSDANTVAHLLPIAKELGFTVSVGHLTCTKSGAADDEWGANSWRSSPEFSEVDTTCEISQLVCLSHEKKFSFTKFTVYEEDLIPKEPFEDVSSDRTEYEPFTGNEAGSLEKWYERSVLVLFRDKDDMSITISVKGIPWAIQRLNKLASNQSLQKKASKFASHLVTHLRDMEKDQADWSWDYDDERSRFKVAMAVMNYAVAAKNSKRWNSAFQFCAWSKSLDPVLDAMAKGVEAFGFPVVQLGIKGLISKSGKLDKRLQVIDAVIRRLGSLSTPDWVNELTRVALFFLREASLEDIPTVISRAQTMGVGIIQKLAAGTLSKRPSSYPFFFELARTLHQQRADLGRLQTTDNPHPVVQPDIGHAIRSCVLAALVDWDKATNPPTKAISFPSKFSTSEPNRNRNRTNTQQNVTVVARNSDAVDRVLQLIEFSLYTLADMELCKGVLDTVSRVVDANPATIQAKFKDVFLALIPALRSLVLDDDTAEVTTEPFRSFFRKMISVYLVHVLGTKESIPPLPHLTIGCGKCSECRTLDTFLNDLTTTELTFDKRMDHVQDHIRAAGGKVSDRISFEMVRKSGPRKSKTIYSSLLVKKCPEVLAEYTWKGRQAQARAFLEGVWDDEELEGIMDGRYEDVLKAIDGEKPFVGLDEAGENTATIAPGDSGGQTRSSGFEASAGSESTEDPPVIAGMKRKERDE